LGAQLVFMIIWGAVLVVFMVTVGVWVLVAEARASRKAIGWRRNRARLRCLNVLQILLAIGMFRVWFIVGDWAGALTPSEVREKFGREVPHQWRAVSMSGGVYSEWPCGTVSDNPLGFALCAGLLATIIAALLLSAVYAGRLRAMNSGERSVERSDATDG